MSHVCFPEDIDFTCPVISDNPSASPSVTPCDPSIDFCDFTTTFDLDFGNQNDILDDVNAQSEFSDITTDWVNERNDCRGIDDIYYSFYIDKNENNKSRRKGQASGKCRGKDCPREVSLSFPNKRSDECDDADLLDDLKEVDVFSNVTEIKVDIFNDTVVYENEDKCEAFECSSTQRNASRALFKSFGMSSNESLPECLWEGITCKGHTVASINLSGEVMYYYVICVFIFAIIIAWIPIFLISLRF